MMHLKSKERRGNNAIMQPPESSQPLVGHTWGSNEYPAFPPAARREFGSRSVLHAPTSSTCTVPHNTGTQVLSCHFSDGQSHFLPLVFCHHPVLIFVPFCGESCIYRNEIIQTNSWPFWFYIDTEQCAGQWWQMWGNLSCGAPRIIFLYVCWGEDEGEVSKFAADAFFATRCRPYCLRRQLLTKMLKGDIFIVLDNNGRVVPHNIQCGTNEKWKSEVFRITNNFIYLFL